MSVSAHCTACGYPLRGPRCEACGREGSAPLVEHAPKGGARVLAPSPGDFPELKAAFEAWGRRDFTRMVSECLAVAGVRMTKPEQLDGPSFGWIFLTRTTVVFVVHAQGQLMLESPLVLVPSAQRTPMFRSLLELNQGALGAARFCLRLDRIVLKWVDRVENVSPPKLMSALREVAGASDHFAQLLGHRFSAPLLAPEIKKPNVNPWAILGKAAPLELREPTSVPLRAEGAKQDVADMVTEMSEASFRFNAAAAGDDDELELARDPYEGRHNPAAPLLHKLGAALNGADRVAAVDGGVFSLLLLRSAALWGRGLMPPDVQGLAAYLLVNLGDWVLRLPEIGFKTSPTRPAFALVRELFAAIVQREGVTDPQWDGKVYPLPPFKAADEPRSHVRKFMALMTRCPKDDEVRGLLLEGVLCEMLLRSAPLARDVHDRIVRSLIEPAPPSAVRVHELQNHLTRSWP